MLHRWATRRRRYVFVNACISSYLNTVQSTHQGQWWVRKSRDANMYLVLCLSGENDTVQDYGTILGVTGSKQRDSDTNIVTFQCLQGTVTVELENAVPDNCDKMFSDCFDSHTKFTSIVDIFLY